MPSDIQGIAGSPAVPAASPPATAAADRGLGFHDVLSALNPLQYLPVVGTIYRAITGDVVPEGLRRLGSMLVSGLTGGPVGLVMNIAATLAEKATGFDPEAIIMAQFKGPAATVGATVQSAAAPAAEAPSGPVPAAWTQAQLTAYGVGTNSAGNLTLGPIEGADVLNAIQLANLTRTAAAAYAANQPGRA